MVVDTREGIQTGIVFIVTLYKEDNLYTRIVYTRESLHTGTTYTQI